MFGENDSRRLSNFYKFKFLQTLIIFQESTIKLTTGIFDFQKEIIRTIFVMISLAGELQEVLG